MTFVDFVVTPGGALRGGVPVPTDKSIAHRALILGALASGPSQLQGVAPLGATAVTRRALEALGVQFTEESPGQLRVQGVGLGGLRPPAAPIDCGGSGTSFRLLAGLLAAQRFASTLSADAYLSQRPMARVVAPLRRRGAVIEGRFHPSRAGELLPPLAIGPLPPEAALLECEESLPIPSAQVKSALLLSGLYADGNTYIREPVVSRDHTERMLRALGVPVQAVASMVELDVAQWNRRIPPFSIQIPGDLSSAAFLLVGALLLPGSELTLRQVGLNPTRRGFIEYLRDVGAPLAVEERGDQMGEPIGDLQLMYGGPLRHGSLGGETLVRAIDEVPAVCVLAARSEGVTEICDAAELRVKESDRLAAMARVLRAFGVRCEELPDGLRIEGQPEGPLRAAEVESGGDHRIAMAATLLALVADGPSRVRDVGCVGTSFPRFAGTLRALGVAVCAVERDSQ
jgi:3-phosphoshikimate 1-carboxyvinyltransferase